jgi:heat shock protein HslJ
MTGTMRPHHASRAVMRIRPILVGLALTACGGLPGATLDGTEWVSIAVTEDGANRPLVDGTQISLRFADDQIGASAGCNTMSGAYGTDSGTLIVETAGTTEMGCDEERHAQDDWLFGLLGSRPEITQDGDKLILTADATVITLQDREVAEPDLPLTGTTWTVDSIVSGDAVSSVPAGATATLVFTDDGRLELDNGCNVGGGTYEVTDGTLRVGVLETTLRACEAAAAQLESAVMSVLNAGELEWSIDASFLTLMAGDNGLGLLGD